MTSQAGSKVELVLKQWAIPEATVDFELGLDEKYLMDGEGPFELHMAFSVRQANLVSASTGESYLLATMVPQLRRKLTRRPSEAEGAVNLMRKTMATAEEENKLKKQAKAKAKMGVRALRKAMPADNSAELDDPVEASEDEGKGNEGKGEGKGDGNSEAPAAQEEKGKGEKGKVAGKQAKPKADAARPKEAPPSPPK